MKIAFLTLGCKVNSYETEKMKQAFEEAGHFVVAFDEQADVYLINTCTVTNIADRKSRKMLHRARRMNPDAVIVAAGCYVDSAAKKGEIDESVDLFISNKEKDNLLELVTAKVKEKGKNSAPEKQEETISQKALEQEHTRAYLKVQNGCNQYCTYCIIPYVRGPLTSKKEDVVLEEVKKLADAGIQEVVVTGIHLSSYGVDFTDKKSFLDLEGKPLLSLLKKIAQVEGIERIRLGSLEPRIITEEFAKELATITKICPHFHLSLQSGCDETLRRMNRHYSTQEYLDKLAILRRYFVHPAITTDIIVGFPQEMEEEFQTTCAFAKEAGFAQIHVFKYSRRQGTMADAMPGQIEESVKVKRSEKLIAIEKELEQKYQSAFLEKEEEVLLEEVVEENGKKYLAGYNERYVRIGIPVEEENTDTAQRCNTIATVRILGHASDSMLLGEYR